MPKQVWLGLALGVGGRARLLNKGRRGAKADGCGREGGLGQLDQGKKERE